VDLLLTGPGILYQRLTEQKERVSTALAVYPVGASSLHAICQSEGKVTVVLEVGLGCTHLDLSLVHHLAKWE
jgi:hypothetical protein